MEPLGCWGEGRTDRPCRARGRVQTVPPERSELGAVFVGRACRGPRVTFERHHLGGGVGARWMVRVVRTKGHGWTFATPSHRAVDKVPRGGP